MDKQKRNPDRGIVLLCRFSVVLALLCGCEKQEYPQARAIRFLEKGTQSGFRYAVYDESLQVWTSELGSSAVRSDGTGNLYDPYDATRTYWPEGRVYSFFAAGCDGLIPDAGACSFVRDGQDLTLELFNPGHDRDFLAAKAVNQSKVDGISMEFRHAGARITNLNMKPEAWLGSLTEKGMAAVADLIISSVTITDAESQEYLFSRSGSSVFVEDCFDYRDCPAVEIGGLSGCSAGLRIKGTTLPVSYYTFPGTHTLSVSFHAVGYGGNTLLGEKTLSGVFSINAGESAALDIVLDPVNDALVIDLGFTISNWQNGGNGQVNE